MKSALEAVSKFHMSEPSTAQSMTTEEVHARASQLLEGYIREYHQALFWYLRQNCRATAEMAEDVLQNLWLHVFQQLTLKRKDQMYKSFLYNKAYWIFLDLQTKGNLEDPFSHIGFKSYDELEKEHEDIGREMLKSEYENSQLPSRYHKGAQRPEPSNPEEEAALIESFWANYPDVDLNEQQKLITFELFRYGLTIKEISGKYDIPISTVSDWKRKIQHEIEKSHNFEEEES